MALPLLQGALHLYQNAENVAKTVQQNPPLGSLAKNYMQTVVNETQGDGQQPITNNDLGGGGGTPQPTQPSGPSQADIDSVFNPTFDYISGLESAVREDYPSIQGDIEGQFGASQQALQAERQAGSRQIEESGVQAEQRKTDALNAARNLYNELMMGGQQRFGGASSAGDAFRTLGAREFQRNTGNIQQGFEQTMRQINDAKINLQQRFEASMAQLEAQKSQALNEARRAFENRLSEINRLKSQAESDKAAMRLEALQQLRNTVSGINQETAGLQQALTTQVQADATRLNQYQQQASQSTGQASQATGNLINRTTTNPLTDLNIGGVSGQSGQFIQGSINRDEDEENNF